METKKRRHGKAKPAPAPNSLLVPGLSAYVEEDPSDGGSMGLVRGTLCYEEKLWSCGTLVIGKPGGGKTLRVMDRFAFAAIRNPAASLVFFDPQGTETQRLVAYARHVRGSDTPIAIINPMDRNAQRFNPIEGISGKDKAYAAAESLVQSAGKPGSNESPYWRQQATLYLAFLILAVNQIRHGQGSLADIREIIDGGSRALKAVGKRSKMPQLTEFGETVESNSNAQTVLSEMSNALVPWISAELCKATSTSSFSIEMLVEKPAILIVSSTEADVRRMRGFFNLLTIKLFDWVAGCSSRHGGRLPRPLNVFIDEFPLLGRLVNIDTVLCSIRKRGAGIWAAVQSITQLDSVYGEEAVPTRAGFGSMIAVPPLDCADAAFLSSSSGFIDVNQHTTNSNGAVTGSERITRPLLLPGEIGTGDSSGKELGPRMTFMLSGRRVFQGHLDALYQRPEEADFVDPPRQPVVTQPSRDGSKEEPAIPIMRLVEDAGLTDAELKACICLLESRLGLYEGQREAWEEWRSFKKNNAGHARNILQAAEQLLELKGNLDSLASVCANAKSTSAIMTCVQLLAYEEMDKSEPEPLPLRQEHLLDDLFQDEPDPDDMPF